MLTGGCCCCYCDGFCNGFCDGHIVLLQVAFNTSSVLSNDGEAYYLRWEPIALKLPLSQDTPDNTRSNDTRSCYWYKVRSNSSKQVLYKSSVRCMVHEASNPGTRLRGSTLVRPSIVPWWQQLSSLTALLYVTNQVQYLV